MELKNQYENAWPLRFASGLLGSAVLINLYLIGVKLRWYGAAGCGLESSCHSVLQSAFGELFGIPVSFFALPVYLVGLFLIYSKSSLVQGRRLRLGLLLLGIAIGGGLWFLYVQAFVLQAYCPYCLASHLLGVGGVLAASFAFSENPIRPRNCGITALGVVVTIGVLATQLASRSPEPIHAGTADSEYEWGAYQKTIRIASTPSDLDPTSDRILCIFDYTCEHCRDMQRMLVEMVDAGELPQLILIPVPMHQDCNPLFRQSGKKATGIHTYAYKLATLAMELWSVDPAQFWRFHQQLIQQEALIPGTPVESLIAQYRSRAKGLSPDAKTEVENQLNRNTALFQAHYANYKRSLLPQLKIGNRVLFGEVRKTKRQSILADIE